MQIFHMLDKRLSTGSSVVDMLRQIAAYCGTLR